VSLLSTEREGSRHTAREIAQQPSVWPRVIDLLERRGDEIRAFLESAGARDRPGTRPGAGSDGVPGASLLLTGAGSSDYIGRAAASSLRERLGREITAVPTTHLVTHPGSHFIAGRPALVVHFARSGDSPESLAAWRFLRRIRPDARHLVITCNENGALRREASRDPGALVLTLPPETNDRSLAMTSSFTSMTLCAIGLGWIDALPDLRRRVEAASEAARGIIELHGEAIDAFAHRNFRRACFLGSDGLEGAMCEGSLKMLEMTAGRVAVISNSFLGVRHGPQIFIDDDCAVVACLSSDPKVRCYETDLLRELRRKGQGGSVMALSVHDDPTLSDCVDLPIVLLPGRVGVREIPDFLRVLTDIVACQVLAFSRSRALGLMPDNPSPGGVISRVVQGVTVYD
jgi:tagatose-6-phosphate ketose/aldose isomerase